MKHNTDSERKAEIDIRLSVFEIPPMQDVLLVGKRAAIGPEAVRRMVDALSPEQYEIIRIDHQHFEAIVIRNTLLTMIPKEKITEIILDEAGRIGNESSVIKAQINLIIHIKRQVDL